MSRTEARVLLPMYDYEPSLSLDHEDRASSTDDGSAGFFPDTPLSYTGNREFDDKSVVVISAEGVVEVESDFDEEKPPPPEDDEQSELSPEARAMLPAPNSCPRSGTSQEGVRLSSGNAFRTD
jgi:hypothetical protein